MCEQTAAEERNNMLKFTTTTKSSVKIHPREKPQNIFGKTDENLLKYNTFSKKRQYQPQFKNKNEQQK